MATSTRFLGDWLRTDFAFATSARKEGGKMDGSGA